MVKILSGKSGSGKSTEIFARIKRDCENGTRSLLIVPEQKTVLCEREIAEKLSPSAQLYTEVTNFTRLCDKVFRQTGGLKYNYISSSGKALVMYRAICEVRDSLTEYKIKKGREKSVVGVFLDAIGELKSYSVTADKLEKAIQSGEKTVLMRKMTDLLLIMRTYENILNESFSDPYDDMIMLKTKLSENDVLSGVNVYIDSFYGFTGSQIAVIEQIIRQSDNVTFAIDCPREYENGGIGYAKLSDTVKKIVSICAKTGIKCEKEYFETDFFRNKESIKFLYNNIWNFSAEKFGSSDGIELWKCADAFDECSFVASKIKSLIEGGARYKDIAVITANSDTYRGVVDFLFDKYKIPYYFSQRTNLYSKPLVKMIFSALESINSYRVQDVISYAKCGFTDICADDGDLLCEYMYKWNIYGKRKFTDDDFWASNPDGYVTEPTVTQAETLAKILDVRGKISEKLKILEKPFENGGKFSDCARGVYEFLELHDVKNKLKEQIKNAPKDEAMELSQIYSAIMKSLDTAVSVMKDTCVDIAGFAAILRYALDGVKIGTIPTGDDTVTIGSANEIRTEKIKYVFVLGVNGGVFPREVSDNGFFSDSDKVELETLGIVLSEKTDVRADNELLDFANSIGCASDFVCVSATENASDGTKNDVSIAFSRIEELFENIKINDTSSLPTYYGICTEEIAREHMGENSEVAEVICELLGENKKENDFSNEDLKISRETANVIFGKNLFLSQSRIETFASCHFQYYCKYLLNLKSVEKISFSNSNIGDLMHKVFEKFLSKVKSENIDINTLTDEETEKTVDEIIEEYVENINRYGAKTNRLSHLFVRLRANIVAFVKNIVAELRDGDFKAEYFEIPFGKSSQKDTPPPLLFKIGDKASMTINGICDRVDIFRKDGKTYVRIVDYKKGTKKFNRSQLSLGMGLQMLVYLFTLIRMGDCDFRKGFMQNTDEILPAGVMYIPFNTGKTVLKNEENIFAPDIEKKEEESVSENIKRNGLFLNDIEIIRAQDKNLDGKYIPNYKKSTDSFIDFSEFEKIYKEMEKTLDEIGASMLDGDAKAKPLFDEYKNSSCEYCENRAVCRRVKRRSV